MILSDSDALSQRLHPRQASSFSSCFFLLNQLRKFKKILRVLDPLLWAQYLPSRGANNALEAPHLGPYLEHVRGPIKYVGRQQNGLFAESHNRIWSLPPTHPVKQCEPDLSVGNGYI